MVYGVRLASRRSMRKSSAIYVMQMLLYASFDTPKCSVHGEGLHHGRRSNMAESLRTITERMILFKTDPGGEKREE